MVKMKHRWSLKQNAISSFDSRPDAASVSGIPTQNTTLSGSRKSP